MTWKPRRGRRGVRAVAGLTGAFLAAGTLVACGGGSDDSSGSSGAFGGDITGTLTVWDQRSASQPEWGKVVDTANAAFEKAHPGVTIKMVQQPTDPDAYSAAIKGAVTAKSGPDVLSITQGYNGILQYTEAMEPLWGHLDAATKDNILGWPLVRPKYATSGEVYAVPIGLQSFVLAYNKKLFAQAGLDPSKPPTTFDELIADGKALKAKGITALDGGNKEGYINGWWTSFLGASLLTQEQTTQMALGDLPANDPAMKTVYTKYQQVYQELYAPSYLSTSINPDLGIGSFKKGKSAMVMWLGSRMADLSTSIGKDNVGVATAISIDGKGPNYRPAAPDYTYAVPRFAKNKAAALAYIEYITGAEIQGKLYQAGQLLPNNKAVDLGSGGTAGQVAVTVAKDYADNPILNGIHSLWQLPVEQESERQLQLVLQRSTSVDDALKAVKNAQDVAKSGG